MNLVAPRDGKVGRYRSEEAVEKLLPFPNGYSGIGLAVLAPYIGASDPRLVKVLPEEAFFSTPSGWPLMRPAAAQTGARGLGLPARTGRRAPPVVSARRGMREGVINNYTFHR
ncbi:MAG: hypothetical protein P9F19_15625 [Candidatus Contendobacter sp.]|nr:hypothetical protein [Candidatus Contendobacter sp.]MDG4558800.1 hypothetical protein [Candidatus Contendobacter sp.]